MLGLKLNHVSKSVFCYLNNVLFSLNGATNLYRLYEIY